MTILKSEQRDPRSWFDWLLLGVLMRQPCPSYIGDYKGQKIECSYRRGHTGRHKDNKADITWGYGDNWLE